MIAGGLFLIWKATTEIHEHVAGEAEPEPTPAGVAGMTMAGAIGQILVLDLVFSLDSIITAVGMTNDIPIMVAAVLVAVGVSVRGRVGVAEAGAADVAEAELKIIGATHRARSPAGEPEASTVRMNETFCPTNGLRSRSAA